MAGDMRRWNGANNRDKTECPQGHPLAGDNLLSADLKRGRRGCVACHYARKKAYRARLKQEAQNVG